MKHPVDVHVGKRVRHRRWMVGMTQQQLGDIVGIKFQQIQKYETGMNRISASRLWDIAQALDVSISFFFEGIEGEITRIWSHSGSPAMDLLLSRGNAALQAEDYPTALEHFSALIDHAPDFAEGWNGRATTFYLMGEYALSIADVERVLALEPRHFGALSGLAFMFEAMEEPELALQALHMVQKLNPNRPNINDAVKRLEQMNGEADL